MPIYQPNTTIPGFHRISTAKTTFIMGITSSSLSAYTAAIENAVIHEEMILAMYEEQTKIARGAGLVFANKAWWACSANLAEFEKMLKLINNATKLDYMDTGAFMTMLEDAGLVKKACCVVNEFVCNHKHKHLESADEFMKNAANLCIDDLLMRLLYDALTEPIDSSPITQFLVKMLGRRHDGRHDVVALERILPLRYCSAKASEFMTKLRVVEARLAEKGVGAEELKALRKKKASLQEMVRCELM